MKKIMLIALLLALTQWWFTDPTVIAPSNGSEFGYIVKYPGGGGRNDALPMLVALHGNGATAENFYKTALNQINIPVRIVVLKGPIPAGRGSAWPWDETSFNEHGKAINEVIEALSLKYPTIKKPLLIGYSGGGGMAYYEAINNGDSYSYIFPVSGSLPPKLPIKRSFSGGVKVFAFHGNQDNVVSVGSGRRAVELLRKNGIEVNYAEFDGDHHGIFYEMKPKISKIVEDKISSLM